VTTLIHNKVRLAVHQLREGTGRPLLLLHGLGERSPEAVPARASAWPGPIHALDFTGHGDSTVPRGGGYSAELLMADVAITLEHLGPSTVVGRGLGAYVAVLVAGARPELVHGVVLEDGPGLFGGAMGPTSAVVQVAPDAGGPPVASQPPEPIPGAPPGSTVPPNPDDLEPPPGRITYIPITSSAFDEEDVIDYHPVRSSFDTQDKIDYHPVP